MTYLLKVQSTHHFREARGIGENDQTSIQFVNCGRQGDFTPNSEQIRLLPLLCRCWHDSTRSTSGTAKTYLWSGEFGDVPLFRVDWALHISRVWWSDVNSFKWAFSSLQPRPYCVVNIHILRVTLLVQYSMCLGWKVDKHSRRRVQ